MSNDAASLDRPPNSGGISPPTATEQQITSMLGQAAPRRYLPAQLISTEQQIFQLPTPALPAQLISTEQQIFQLGPSLCSTDFRSNRSPAWTTPSVSLRGISTELDSIPSLDRPPNSGGISQLISTEQQIFQNSLRSNDWTAWTAQLRRYLPAVEVPLEQQILQSQDESRPNSGGISPIN